VLGDCSVIWGYEHVIGEWRCITLRVRLSPDACTVSSVDDWWFHWHSAGAVPPASCDAESRAVKSSRRAAPPDDVLRFNITVTGGQYDGPDRPAGRPAVNHCTVNASQTRSQRASLCFPAPSAALSAICHPCLAPCLPFPVCRCISSGLAPVTGRAGAADPQIRPAAAAVATVLQWQTVQLSLADYRHWPQHVLGPAADAAALCEVDTHDESALKCVTGLVDRRMDTAQSRLFSAAAVSIIDSQRVVGRHCCCWACRWGLLPRGIPHIWTVDHFTARRRIVSAKKTHLEKNDASCRLRIVCDVSPHHSVSVQWLVCLTNTVITVVWWPREPTAPCIASTYWLQPASPEFIGLNKDQMAE